MELNGQTYTVQSVMRTAVERSFGSLPRSCAQGATLTGVVSRSIYFTTNRPVLTFFDEVFCHPFSPLHRLFKWL